MKEIYIKRKQETMKRNFQSFTNNNHAKRCRLLMPRMHKPGWRETHTFQKKRLKSSVTTVIITGDSIAAVLRTCLEELF